MVESGAGIFTVIDRYHRVRTAETNSAVVVAHGEVAAALRQGTAKIAGRNNNVYR